MDQPSPGGGRRPGKIAWLAVASAVLVSGFAAAAYYRSREEGRPAEELAPKPVEVVESHASGPASEDPDRSGKQPVRQSPAGQGLASFDDWLQDVEAAKKKAAAEGKDMLLAFLGPDGFSIRLTYEVLQQREFRAQIDGRYVPVLIDFPREAAAKARVQDARRNAQVKREFLVKRLPRVVVTDARGFPYAIFDYAEGGVEPFVGQLARWQSRRQERDRLFQEIDAAEGEARIAAIERAFGLLNEIKLLSFYGPVLNRWLDLVRQLDPKKERAIHEALFEATWMLSLGRMETDQPDPKAVDLKIAELDQWMAGHRFQDPDRAASLHLYAAGLLAAARQPPMAMKHIEAALACQPRNPILRQQINDAAASIRGVGMGTGFVVAPGGLVMTNFHVVEGPGRVLVLLPGRSEPCPARLVAQDVRRDVALLRIAPPPGSKLAPVPLSPAAARRGARVLAIGFPPTTHLGDAALKLTQGIVSSTPEENADRMLVLDCRVNPGNSGGPLCDVYGNAVGMVTAKTVGRAGVESYGMALPADVLREFLLQHVPENELARPSSSSAPLEWDQVDRLVSPSVLMILRAQ